MSRSFKAAFALVFATSLLVSPIARAGQNTEGEEASAGEVGSQKERSFEETRDFMKKHSEESKKTGKM